MNLNYINSAITAYLLACIFYFVNTVFKSKLSGKLATIMLGLGFFTHTLAVGARWYMAGRPPFVNMYESLIFFSWATVFIYLISEFVYKFKLLGIPVTLLALLGLGYASFLDRSIEPLLPALQSNWLTIHVITYFIGYGSVAVAFGASIFYLIFLKRKSSLSSLCSHLDLLSYRFIAFGFPFLTLGLTTGAVWANIVGGTWWSWDPKETWSLITWLIYALYLHLRLMRGWQGPLAAYLSIIGFLAVLVTFLGVNYLLGGLHSYAQ